MEVRKLHPIFAAELIGADLSQPPSQELIDLVEAAMAEHVVLCIRGDVIDDEAHLRFARAFGPLELPGAYNPDAPRRMAYGLYDASNLDVNGDIIERESLRAKFAKGNELFHSDSSFNDMPSKWSMLRSLIVPPEKGYTEFVDLRHVYDELPQETKDKIETLVAEHSFLASRIKGGVDPEEVERLKVQWPGAKQPLVRVGPDGRKSLFVGSHAYRIDGMEDKEAQAFLAELLEFASQRKYIYAHKWHVGDMLIWSNRYALHRGTEFDYERYKRDLRRANVNEFGEERSATSVVLPAQDETKAGRSSRPDRFS